VERKGEEGLRVSKVSKVRGMGFAIPARKGGK